MLINCDTYVQHSEICCITPAHITIYILNGRPGDNSDIHTDSIKSAAEEAWRMIKINSLLDTEPEYADHDRI